MFKNFGVDGKSSRINTLTKVVYFIKKEVYVLIIYNETSLD